LEPNNQNNQENDPGQQVVNKMKPIGDTYIGKKGKTVLANKGKQVGGRALKIVGKVLKAGVKKAGIALAGILGPVGVAFALILIMVLILFGGIYCAMTQETALTGPVAQAGDPIIKARAIKRTDVANIFSTYKVDGEGSWHDQYAPVLSADSLYDTFLDQSINDQNKLTTYTGVKPGFLGQMVDNEGKDQEFKSGWGDAYAPVLFNALKTSSDNLMSDKNFVNTGIDKAAFALKPYFYYKPSIVTITTTDSKGESTTTVSNIYLLVEVYSIRGHYQYQYEWKTTSGPGWSITKEYLKNRILLSDGKPYLTQYLNTYLNLEDRTDNPLIVETVFQAMQGFTAKSEWLAWCLSNGVTMNEMVSMASIPADYYNMLKDASNLTGIPIAVLSAIILEESAWDPNAVNSSTGCFGLTQLNPQFWESWCQTYGFDPVNDKWNPRAQIMIGAQVSESYFPSAVNWEGDWANDPSFRAAMAKYGGYGEDVTSATDYIDAIVAKAVAYETRPTTFPIEGEDITTAKITSPFGYRKDPLGRPSDFHHGIDFGVSVGTNVCSITSGIVTEVGHNDPTWGNYIILHDMTYGYIYGHLSETLVDVNSPVTPGMVIGKSGNTGDSTGPHLHFGVGMAGVDMKGTQGLIDPLSILQ
jgi:hypothetical protein